MFSITFNLLRPYIVQFREIYSQNFTAFSLQMYIYEIRFYPIFQNHRMISNENKQQEASPYAQILCKEE